MGRSGPDRRAATDVRNRAFTLLVHTYEESRRAVQYLRFWEGDADDLAPSMYEKHRGKQGQNGGQERASPGTLSNAGLWLLGRLQTEADRQRVLDGLHHAQKSAERASLDLTTWYSAWRPAGSLCATRSRLPNRS